MADFVRCPRCDRLFGVGDGEDLYPHNTKAGILCEEKPAVNHPTHTFGTVDDCIRCLNCEVLYFGLQSGAPCPARFEFSVNMGDPAIVAKLKPAQAEAERQPFQYLEDRNANVSVLPEAVELSFDRDSGRFAYPEDVNW